MSLTLVVNGANVFATDVNQVVNVLQQPSGGQEHGHYFLGGNAYTSSARISTFVKSISRTSVPVSVSIDTADVAPSNLGSPTTDNVVAGGFHVLTTSTGTHTNCNTAGNYTLQY